MNRIIVSLLLFVGASALYAETTHYVSDQLRITLRSGQGNQYQIIRALESGTPLVVTEQTDTGYSHVRLDDGTEGWVRSQYLITEPIAKDRLATAEARLEKLSKQLKVLKQERDTLREENKTLASVKQQLEKETTGLSDKLKYVTEVTGKPKLELEESNNTLQQANLELEKGLQRLSQEVQVLRDRSNREWFIAGAGVLIAGMLLGLIFPKIRWKRKSSW